MPDKPNNPPAFPTYQHPTEGFDVPGMTLRDWFAGMALRACSYQRSENPRYHANVAKEAYMMADAMLAEREKRDA